MNLKVALTVLSVLVAAALLAAHSPLRLLNALTPTNTFRLFADIPYGPGERQVLDVYLPARVARDWPTEPNAGAPVVVFFYGGSWQSGKRNDYLFVGEALASRGFVAVVPDYRTYPATTFPGFIDDAARAVAWARGHAAAFGGDPRRVFLMGHSAGAQIAALLATDGRYLAASKMRNSEIAGVIGLAGPYDFCRCAMRRSNGSSPATSVRRASRSASCGATSRRCGWPSPRTIRWSSPEIPIDSRGRCRTPAIASWSRATGI